MTRTLTPVFLMTSLVLAAQVPNPTQGPAAPPAQGALNQTGVPIFRVEVVERSTPAINYLHRGGSTKLDFHGIPLMAASKGEAKVESERVVIHVSANYEHMAPPL